MDGAFSSVLQGPDGSRIDWLVWRPVLRGLARSHREVLRWSVPEVFEANITLNLWDQATKAAEEASRKKAETEAKRKE